MNNKKQMLILSIVIIFVFSLLIIVYYFKDNNKTIIMNEKNTNNNNAISIMLETGFETGVYELSESTTFPSSGYILNTTRSGCENGSTLSYDDTMNKVVIKGNISDKCYIYFDSLPPSIDLAIPDCPNAVTSWDRGLQQLAVTSFTTSSLECTLQEENISNVTRLNNYILGLSETNQGEGKLVHEMGEIPDYTNTTIVKSFGTTPVYFRYTSATSTSQSSADSYWTFNSTTGVFTSDPSKMTASGTSNYYHAYAQVPSAGYYQICYTIAQSANASNTLVMVRNQSQIRYISSSTSAQVGEACYDMGYFTSTDYINISEKGYSGTSSPIMSFRIEKANKLTSIDTGYRYEGENPNNYIMFNNELWRIIGVFSTEYDSNGDGTTDATTNLVKIIRKESIGGLVWDTFNTNDWTNSSLYQLLNKQYYDWNTNKSRVTTYCYGYSTTVPAKCDYSVKGIQDEYRGMILRTKWYLGGPGKTGYTNYTSNYIYSYERNADAIYTGRSASVLGYIGLMYESDYLYSVLASDCDRNTDHESYNTADCAGKDWLYGEGHEWTISQDSYNSTIAWDLYDGGDVAEYTNSGHVVRPVLYLSDYVYRISGTGTITDPYIIGM